MSLLVYFNQGILLQYSLGKPKSYKIFKSYKSSIYYIIIYNNQGCFLRPPLPVENCRETMGGRRVSRNIPDEDNESCKRFMNRVV